MQSCRPDAWRQVSAVLINKKRRHHLELKENLHNANLKGKIVTRCRPAEKVIREILDSLSDHTVFAYLDPFASPEFDIVKPFLLRSRRFSTEVVINLNAGIMHRLAATQASKARRSAETVQRLNTKLTAILGGQYWRPIFEDDSMSPEEKVVAVASQYRRQLAQYLPHTGCCPVRWTSSGPIKYFIVFCSRHEDGMLLMNDTMFRAYNQGLHKADTQGTLFELFDWRIYRFVVDPPPIDLEAAIVEEVKSNPRQSRKRTWIALVQKYFMAFDQTGYKKAVQELVSDGILGFVDVRHTRKLNDDSLLYIDA